MTGGACTAGACTSSCLSNRSGEGSLVGGAMGNLKLDENEPEGFRPVVGRIGVLGEVVVPGLFLDGRAGKVKSFGGSWTVGGKEAPPARGEGCVAERKPGDGAGYEEGRMGITCMLEDLPCPRLGLVGVVLPWWLPPVAASVPREMMDMERPCLWPRPWLPNGPAGEAGEDMSPATEEACRDGAGRWPPRRCGEPGIWERKDELRDIDEWTGGSLRWRSPPGAKPLCLRAGEGSRPSGLATFLKVMVHCTSSPANTVESFHCTNTRIFDEDMVGGRGRAAGMFALQAAHLVRLLSGMARRWSRRGRPGWSATPMEGCWVLLSWPSRHATDDMVRRGLANAPA